MVQFLESISLQTSNHFTLLLLKKHIDFAQIAKILSGQYHWILTYKHAIWRLLRHFC